jgi:hypothetical protein
MRPAARKRQLELVEKRLYASVDDVPSYEWKTPLQRSIQIMKRHRDVMFKDASQWKPLSMIITTLATHSYNGETGLYEALRNIVDGMLSHVNVSRPRVPNPVNPAEDFADRWARDARYEENFRLWHAKIKADLANMVRLIGRTSDMTQSVREKFALELTADMRKDLDSSTPSQERLIVTAAPAVHISSPPKPWRRDE